MGRGPIVAAAPQAPPKRVLRRKADWRKRCAYLAAAVCVAAAVLYLEATRGPTQQVRGRASAKNRADSGWQWRELLNGLQDQRRVDMALFRSLAAKDAAAGRAPAAHWYDLPTEERGVALERAHARLLRDPLLLRLTEHNTAEEAREMALKIAPELENVPADTGFDAPKLLQALLDGVENANVLPPAYEVQPGAKADEIAAQQMLLLRHVLRSSMLTSFVRHVLEPTYVSAVDTAEEL